MKSKETIKETLEKWGFPVLQETDNSLIYRFQMNFIQTNITEGEDGAGVAVTLSGIFKAEDEKEMDIALRACNFLNCNLMQVKLYIDADSDLIIAAEFFHEDGEDIGYQLTMALKTTVSAKKKFLQKYREIADEVNLMSELEKE